MDLSGLSRSNSPHDISSPTSFRRWNKKTNSTACTKQSVRAKEYSSTDTEQETHGPKKRPKRRKRTSSPRSSLPQKVSSWKLKHAVKMGIRYDIDYVKGLEGLIQKIRGNIKTFTEEQEDYVEVLNGLLTFTLTVKHFYAGDPKRELFEQELDPILERIDHGQVFKENNGHNWIYRKVKTFIYYMKKIYDSVRTYNRNERSRPGVPEGFLTHFVGAFADICCLGVEYCNEACQVVWENLDGVHQITSEPDLRLFKRGLDEEYSSKEIISVVEVKTIYDGMCSSEDSECVRPAKKKIKGSLRSSEESDVDSRKDSDTIMLNLHDDVLGQHAGQLLLDLNVKYGDIEPESYEDNKKINMLGMIVHETDVYITVLEMTWKHYQKLKNNKELDNEDNATIYYTLPRDILVGKERRSLISDFMSLNNVEFT